MEQSFENLEGFWLQTLTELPHPISLKQNAFILRHVLYR